MATQIEHFARRFFIGALLIAGPMMQFSVMAAASKTIEDRVQQFGPVARKRLKPFFEQAGYPPEQLVFVGLKAERVLQVYAKNGINGYRFLRSYPILAASGGPGPKLREGDLQVPEGIYPVESLNPNSRFHLSLRIGYPNAF